MSTTNSKQNMHFGHAAVRVGASRPTSAEAKNLGPRQAVLTFSNINHLALGLILILGGGVVAMVVWPASRRARPLLYVGAAIAAWRFVAWWAAVIIVIACGVMELGILLWGLADRAERRLGKRE